MEDKYYVRICKMCGEFFESKTKNILYCCNECRSKASAISRENANELRRMKRRAPVVRPSAHHYSDPCEYARRQIAETVEMYARIDTNTLMREILGV